MVRWPVEGRGLVIIKASRLHSVTHSPISYTPLDEWSAQLRCLHLTTCNTHKRQTLTSPAGFETAVPVSERPQAYDLDRANTGIGIQFILHYLRCIHNVLF